MTTIKIRDAEWFETHCCPGEENGFLCLCQRIRPKGKHWDNLDKECSLLYWLNDGDDEGDMNALVGKVLEVTLTDDVSADADMQQSAKYYAGGYWIPNWAIEWVSEEAKC